MQSVNKGISKPYPQLVMTYPEILAVYAHRRAGQRSIPKTFTQRFEVDHRAGRSLSIEDGRDRGGVYVQLVLAGGWFDGAGSNRIYRGSWILALALQRSVQVGSSDVSEHFIRSRENRMRNLSAALS